MQTGYLQPSDFPQYHRSIKDHAINHNSLLAAVAQHKQQVWDDELAVTLEYREHQERWQNYYYSKQYFPCMILHTAENDLFSKSETGKSRA